MDESKIFSPGSQHECPLHMDFFHMKQQILMKSQRQSVVKDEVPLPLSHCEKYQYSLTQHLLACYQRGPEQYCLHTCC